MWEYVRKGDRGIRLQHNRQIVAGEWVEAMQMPVPVTMRKHADGGEVQYPEGTVFLGVVWKPWAWDLVKKGKIRGFSIGGSSGRIPIEPASMEKAQTKPDVLLPAFVTVKGRRFVIRPEENAILISDGHARHQVSANDLLDAVSKSSDELFGWSMEDRKSVHRQLTLEPPHGLWFRNFDGTWLLAKKKTFASRSDAARYAANIRWQNYHTKVMTSLKDQSETLAKRVKFAADGMPATGPLGMPRTVAGLQLAHRMPSLAGHVDFDKIVAKMSEGNPEKFAADAKVPDPSYEMLRRYMTPERRQIHDALIDSQFAGKTSVKGRDPEYTFLGGGGGSGKTTLLETVGPDGQPIVKVPTRSATPKMKPDGTPDLDENGQPRMSARESGQRDAIEINSDDMKEFMPEYRALTKGGPQGSVTTASGKVLTYDAGRSPSELARYKAANFVHEETSYIAKAVNSRAIKMGMDVVMDGTADGGTGKQAKKLLEVQNALTKTGRPYKTRLIMATVPTNDAVLRGAERAVKTGRLVPEKAMREAHAGASNSFKEILDSTDKGYDSFEGWDTRTKPPTKFMEGTNKSLKITDQKVYDEFIAKGNEPTGTTDFGKKAMVDAGIPLEAIQGS